MSEYVDKYGNPTHSPLQAWGNSTPSTERGSEPSDEQIDAFERNLAAQEADNRSRDADIDWRDRYRDDD